jgi:hypothetical protein
MSMMTRVIFMYACPFDNAGQGEGRPRVYA